MARPKTYPYEVKFRDHVTGAAIVLGRYETDYLAKRCAGLVRVCVTEGEVDVEFNEKAVAAS